ncbi:T9SS type A sorting domain-containing protein [Polaribacter sp. HL-MS24]|uniref:T9SS type A sorting domain-containing protein n=1 Tax=Polaribacter sp. HL-MS24 TaxID=3077735 RepID=UPI0029351272|nr:T9SS type A sorting domain-containing protein [Polaribacter sp. HL-MS24]WOC41107.1 T9SS type A sorting domain-containing protein [Polaribacter sp. HL-MS24]
MKLQLHLWKTKLLTKFEDKNVNLNVEKSAAGALKGLTLSVQFTPNIVNQLEAFILGPNPSSGQMNLFYNLPKATDMLLLNVYNINGKKVWSSDQIKTMEGTQTMPLNLSFLSNGFYFIRINQYSKGLLQQNEVKRLIIKK